MRRLARIPGCWIAAALLCVPALAQHGKSSAEPRSLGKVIVWIVSPQNDPNPLKSRMKVARASSPLQYQESTAGDFGGTAGSSGQTVGSTGSTMGNFGQTAGSVGQTAGSVGKTSGDFGRAAGSVGRNAGDAGTTMANFGTSTTDLSKVAAAKNGLIPVANQPRRSPYWDGLVTETSLTLKAVGEDKYFVVDVSLVDVYSNDLQALLEATAGTPDAPDVLLGAPLPREWTRQESGLAVRYGVATLWSAPHFAQTEDVPANRRFVPEAAVLASAHNLEGARAFALWLSDRESASGGYVKTPKTDPIAQLALRAMLTLLAGASVGGDADPEMAKVDGQLVAAMVAGPTPVALDQLKVRAEVTHLSIFGKLAFVALRAMGTSAEAFGAAHALVVLRLDGNGHWKVLQVSPNLEAPVQYRAMSLLEAYSAGPAVAATEGSSIMRNESKWVLGISQATPKDGETLSPRPELWWDNLGGATLQAVEWQPGTGDAWGASNLYFIPDNNGRLRTRATASFASVPGQYRWRVWSIGPGGDLVLSPWRTIKIIGG